MSSAKDRMDEKVFRTMLKKSTLTERAGSRSTFTSATHVSNMSIGNLTMTPFKVAPQQQAKQAFIEKSIAFAKYKDQ